VNCGRFQDLGFCNYEVLVWACSLTVAEQKPPYYKLPSAIEYKTPKAHKPQKTSPRDLESCHQEVILHPWPWFLYSLNLSSARKKYSFW